MTIDSVIFLIIFNSFNIKFAMPTIQFVIEFCLNLNSNLAWFYIA